MSAVREGSLAVVTGAGSPTGIGQAIARALGRAGHRLVIASTTDSGSIVTILAPLLTTA